MVLKVMTIEQVRDIWFQARCHGVENTLNGFLLRQNTRRVDIERDNGNAHVRSVITDDEQDNRSR